MSPATLDPAALERIYEALARALDAVDPADESLFLAKLALALANEIGDVGRIEAAIASARAGLPATPAS
ncbi:MAG: DUF2783 domain-containing protein [Gammaproteobacteria bacterium]|nr:DUF2783 domain-containing protein [Gammaproteobacteria bacterium]